MDQAQILPALQDVVRATFFAPGLVIDATTTAEDVDGWDSLSHVRLMMNVEKRFAIKLIASEAGRLRHVGDLLDLIARKLPQ
jgi:acyl carrier protein